jgi:intergrase/recombinase
LKKKKPEKVVKIKQEDFKSVKEIQKESGNLVDDKTKAMRMLFALIHDRGLDVEKWKEWIKKQIGVEHFNEVSIEKMRELYKIYKKLTQYEIEEIKQIIEKQQGGDKNE